MDLDLQLLTNFGQHQRKIAALVFTLTKLTDGRTCTRADDGQKAITKTHFAPMAHVAKTLF